MWANDSARKQIRKKKKYISGKNLKKKIFGNFCKKKVFLVCLIIPLPHEKTRNFLFKGGGKYQQFRGYTFNSRKKCRWHFGSPQCNRKILKKKKLPSKYFNLNSHLLLGINFLLSKRNTCTIRCLIKPTFVRYLREMTRGGEGGDFKWFSSTKFL